jgi:hypothetical protein
MSGEHSSLLAFVRAANPVVWSRVVTADPRRSGMN